MTKPYSEFVAQAEAAVAGVKDAELRRVAFERVLSDLLGADDKVPPKKVGPSAAFAQDRGTAARKETGRPAGLHRRDD